MAFRQSLPGVGRGKVIETGADVGWKMRRAARDEIDVR